VILDVAPTELLVLGAVALVVIPPKDLPKAMRLAGQWIGRARGLARQFRSGFDDMIRESEFAEMEAKWKAENERIMREFPQTPDQAALMAPLVDPLPADADDAPAMVAAPVIEPAPTPAAPPKKPRAKPKAKADPKNAGIERL
jgi:sec-independent protein translocase protein TatB